MDAVFGSVFFWREAVAAVTPIVGSPGLRARPAGRGGAGQFGGHGPWWVSGRCVQGPGGPGGARAGRPSGARAAGAGSGRGQAGPRLWRCRTVRARAPARGGCRALQALSAHGGASPSPCAGRRSRSKRSSVAATADLTGLAPAIPATLEVRTIRVAWARSLFPEHPPSYRPEARSKHTESSNPAKASLSKKKKTQRSQAHIDPLQIALAGPLLGDRLPPPQPTPRQSSWCAMAPSKRSFRNPSWHCQALIPEYHSLGRVKGE